MKLFAYCKILHTFAKDNTKHSTMYTTIIDTTPQHEDNSGCIPCIHCNWSFNYEDEVKEESIKLMQQWNASHDEDDQCDDWKDFVAEAIDNLCRFPYIKTICDNCDYCD